MKKKLAVLIVVVIAVGGCVGGEGDVGSSVAVSTITTKSFSDCFSNTKPGNTNNTHGNFKLSTDIWNPSAAASYSECVNATIDTVLGVKGARFDWDFVARNGQVKTFPNLQFGQQPGFPTSTTTILPALVSSMPNLNVTGKITTTCASSVMCNFDSGFDLFFSNTAMPTTWPPKTELMILSSYKFRYPLGTPVATVTIDGLTFNVFAFTVTPPSGIYSWTLVQYYPISPLTQLHLNVKDFVDDAVSRGYVESTDYLDVVEIGTEVQFGKGSTVLTNYNIQ